jgi:hypothetical protein
MITPALGGLVIGFALVLVAAMTKNEKWMVAYGVAGFIFVFWSLGYFNLDGRFATSLLPAATLLFGLFTMYTKGSAQLLSMLVTMILFFQMVNV